MLKHATQPNPVFATMEMSIPSSRFQQHVNLINPSDCTLKTCPLLETGAINMPQVAPNALYLSIFTLLLLIHFAQGARYKTWDILVIMSTAMLLEVIGYAAKVSMHIDSYAKQMFTMFLLP